MRLGNVIEKISRLNPESRALDSRDLVESSLCIDFMKIECNQRRFGPAHRTDPSEHLIGAQSEFRGRVGSEQFAHPGFNRRPNLHQFPNRLATNTPIGADQLGDLAVDCGGIGVGELVGVGKPTKNHHQRRPVVGADLCVRPSQFRNGRADTEVRPYKPAMESCATSHHVGWGYF